MNPKAMESSSSRPWMRPKVVTLCGSTKFKDDYLTQQKRLTLEGYIVLSVGFFGHADDAHVSDKQKRELDTLHLRKIDISDFIFVVNKGGYIGESTAREIVYAENHGREVFYLEPVEGVTMGFTAQTKDKS